MAGLTSQGVGSGLDIAGLVAKLVAAEKAPRQSQITRAQTSTVTTISALANLKGALSSFNDSLSLLKSADVFAARAANSSDSKIFTASATPDAVPGSYEVEVESLASAHQIASEPFEEGAGGAVGTGTLTFTVGEKTFSVAIDESHNTLAQIRDAINQASDNDDILQATIINAADGAHLVLSANKAGEENLITVAQSGGDGGLADLEYTGPLDDTYTVKREASDAVVYVAGFEHRSTTNNFSDVIDGVSLTLLDTGEEDKTYTLTVADDTASTTGRVRKFVEAFNTLAKQMASLRSYEPATKQAGPLLGDAMLRGIESDLRTRVTGAVSGLSGTYQSLASIGITTQRDGTLSLDSKKLEAALTADFDGVAQLFGAENGVAARLSASLDQHLASEAQISARTKTLNAKSISLQKDQVALETRMQAIERRYNAQFNALDSLLANMSSQSSFLSQQLSNIAKIGSDK